MGIIERGRQFVQGLRAVGARTRQDWRCCPHCGSMLTSKWGTYLRRPWTLQGRTTVRVVRHRCLRCGKTYSETNPELVRRGWYSRGVRRCAIDHWQHLGSSMRRTAEWLRSLLGQQERWLLWHPLAEAPAAPACTLSASTVQRWLDAAGQQAKAQLAGQWAEVATSGQVGLDGLWATLRQGARGVVLLLVDTVTGVCWPPVVRAKEEAASWLALIARAQQAGLDLDRLRGVVSDGGSGIVEALDTALDWVNHQRCVFHLWRGVRGELATAVEQAAAGLHGAAATAVKVRVRRELRTLVRAVFDAPTRAAADAALAHLAADPRGTAIAQRLAPDLDAALVVRNPYNPGLARTNPESVWRDFRRRLSRGRNHGTTDRLERAALRWHVYHNFEPTQARSERRRHYRHPGQAPLTVAGVTLGRLSYLDALGV